MLKKYLYCALLEFYNYLSCAKLEKLTTCIHPQLLQKDWCYYYCYSFTLFMNGWADVNIIKPWLSRWIVERYYVSGLVMRHLSSIQKGRRRWRHIDLILVVIVPSADFIRDRRFSSSWLYSATFQPCVVNIIWYS